MLFFAESSPPGRKSTTRGRVFFSIAGTRAGSLPLRVLFPNLELRSTHRNSGDVFPLDLQYIVWRSENENVQIARFQVISDHLEGLVVMLPAS